MEEKMITGEQAAFLRILSDYLNKRETNPLGEQDWKILTDYASSHQVSGVLYKQCKSFLPDEYASVLALGQSKDIYFYSNRVRLFQGISQELEKQKISFYTAKGLDIAALYPVPSLRTMGDCDIYVHPEDKQKVHEIMLELGYKNYSQADHEWIYFKNDLEFEIHDHLLYDDMVNRQLDKDFTELAWSHTVNLSEDGIYRKQLDWNFHFVFLLLHLKKHLIHYGIGFRQFMDLAVVMQNVDLDWNWIKETLKKLELTAFFGVCCALVRRWFDITIPTSYTDIEDSFYASATQYVFANGVFGFDNEEFGKYSTLNRFVVQTEPLWRIRIRTLVCSIFPSYRALRYLKPYRFVNHRPWLLPVAWICRIYRTLKYRSAESKERMIAIVTASNQKLTAREQELKKWGI